MELRAAVERYLEVAGGFGESMALAAFGLPEEELTKMVAAWDEDYRVNRHFELLPPSGSPGETSYRINGIEYAAIVFHPSISDVFD